MTNTTAVRVGSTQPHGDVDATLLDRSDAVIAELPTPATGPAFEVRDPATESLLTSVPDATTNDGARKRVALATMSPHASGL